MRCLRWLVAGCMFGLVFVADAGAAYVRAADRTVNSGGPVTLHDVVYDGEGSEFNRVVVTGNRTAVQFADPGKTIRTDPLTPPGFDGNGNPRATWGCATPGSSVAVCAATPGSRCSSLNCTAPGPAPFTGLLKVAGNTGNDHIAIVSLNFEGRVWGGYGDDVIAVVNSSLETVDCGPGADKVVADARDVVKTNCESVTRR